MGKASKKLNKKKQQQNVKVENKQIEELKAKLDKQIQDMSYAAALETLAELVEKKCIEPDVIFKGAQVYFLMGDYERAAGWVNNTLHYAPQHLAARLLLAKICVLEDRLDDAMAVYTFVLQNYQTILTEQQREEIKEGTDYTWRTDREWLLENYPLVAKLWDEKSTQQPVVGPEPTENAVESVETIIQEITGKNISLLEKIRMLNTFAGGYLVAHELSAAQKLLEKALSCDEYDRQTLTNLAILYKIKGEREQALKIAAKIPQTDFGLLYQLMEKNDVI